MRGQFEDYLLCDALDVPRGSFYNYVVYGKKENTWYHKRRKQYNILIQKYLMKTTRCWEREKSQRSLSKRDIMSAKPL